ncbi:hypothetical protein YC2023_021379 [Brassica napus]
MGSDICLRRCGTQKLSNSYEVDPSSDNYLIWIGIFCRDASKSSIPSTATGHVVSSTYTLIPLLRISKTIIFYLALSVFLHGFRNNMSGSGEWDKRMTETLKNFDLNSPEVKQQFDQIGLTPEEVISKIMQNPDVAMAFQNPRVQAALMECSENPMNIMKYQNDKEVMDVFNKISQLFPGMTG